MTPASSTRARPEVQESIPAESTALGDWWRWPLLLVLPVISATWFASMWPDATWAPWAPRTQELLWWREAGEAVVAGTQVYLPPERPNEAVHFGGTPVGAVLGVAWTWLSPWSMQWVFCALVALVVVLVLHRVGLRGWLLSVAAAALLALPPLHQSLGHGSPFPLLMGLVVLDLVRPPRAAGLSDRLPQGLATGLAVALEPLLAGVLLLLLVAGRLRALATALVTGFFLIVAARWLLPPGSLGRWVRMLTERRMGFSDQVAQPFNESVSGAIARLQGGTPAAVDQAVALAIALAVVAAVAGGLLMRSGQDWTAVGLVGLTGLAALPLGLPTILVFLLPLAIGVLRRGAPGPLRAVALALVLWAVAGAWGAVSERPAHEGPELFVLTASALGITLLVGVALACGLWRLWGRTIPRVPVLSAVRPWLVRGIVLAGTCLVALFIAAIFLEPFDIGWLQWRPRMPDFAVYVKAAHAFVSGGDLYAAGPEEWPFLYPPIAAALASPLALVELGTAQAGWQVITALALLALGHRLGLKGWINGFAVCLAVIAVGPIRHNVGLGQVSIVLMVLALLDVVEGPRFLADRLRGGRPLVPVGVLIGLGAAIKLTPAVFIPYLFLTGRRRAAYWATGTFAAFSALGFAVSPARSWHYWTTIATGSLQFFPDTRGWLHNQSLQSAVQRYLGPDADASRLGLLLGLAVAGLALLAGIRWARRGDHLLGASLTGVATIAAVPVAWHHYYVWIVPLAVALVRAGVPSALRGVGLLWVGWCSVAPFWVLPSDPRLRPEFGYLPDAKLAAGGAALGMIALVVVALAAGRPLWARLGALLSASTGALWAAAARRTPVSASGTPAPAPEDRTARSSSPAGTPAA